MPLDNSRDSTARATTTSAFSTVYLYPFSYFLPILTSIFSVCLHFLLFKFSNFLFDFFIFISTVPPCLASATNPFPRLLSCFHRTSHRQWHCANHHNPDPLGVINLCRLQSKPQFVTTATISHTVVDGGAPFRQIPVGTGDPSQPSFSLD